MDVVVWNMRQNSENWNLLRPGKELGADIHLLCEAPKPPRDVKTVGQWRTLGLAEALPLDKPVIRDWSTAVTARRGATLITDARTAREYKERLPLPFKPSRPGTWTAAQVRIGRVKVTAIALYGLLDEKSDDSVHRSLSELSPIFDHRTYGRHILLGGDLNVFANPRPEDPAQARHLAVLTRLEAYGLENCLDRFKRPMSEALADPCPCGVKDCRRHWRTFRRSPRAPGPAYQEDYLFASKAMVARLEHCEVLSFQPSSDHAPVRARFSI
jgi:endonuclease/exonuclease/phosphatase family metal-dependent hydrolase